MSHLDAAITQYLNALGWPAEAMVQLLIAAFCGGLIGVEREVRGRQAGFRTNLLVCVGSAMVMIASMRMAYHDWGRAATAGQVSVDPSRIAYGIMTGVGFLGAGTIVKSAGNVRGLTTAAGLWCVAALGMVVGQGLYALVGFSTVLLLLSLWVLDHASNLLPRVHYRNVTLRRRWAPGCVDDTITRLTAAGLRVVDASFRRTDDLRDVDIRLHIAFDRKRSFYRFERHLPAGLDYELLAVSE